MDETRSNAPQHGRKSETASPGGPSDRQPASDGWAGHSPTRLPVRRHPAHGLLISPDTPTIVYLTVCTKDRQPWLAAHEVHALLRLVWTAASAWLVGRYILMPDHVHLFAAPGETEIPFDNWIRYWKSQFSKGHHNPNHRWQTDHWDTRLRSWEAYDSKWDYVCNNPVRRGLVAKAEDWPFQGEIHPLY